MPRAMAAAFFFALTVFLVPTVALAKDGAGLLALRSIPADTSILVDGIPKRLAEAERGMKLRAGAHTVTVVFADGRFVQHSVTLDDGDRKRLRVGRTPDEVASENALAPFPMWPAIAATAAAGTGLAVSAIYGIVFLQSRSAYASAVAQAQSSPGQGANAPFAIVPLDLETKGAAMRADGIATLILAPASVVAGIAAIGLWGFYVATAPASAE